MAEPLDDQAVKHLEMLQAVITRLGNDSFLIKGWAVTVTGAFLGFAVSSKQPDLALVAIVPTLLFWLLDVSYLRSERLFRKLYDRVRSDSASVAPFAMGATSKEFLATLSRRERWETANPLRVAMRPTVATLYLGLTVAALLVAHVGPRSARPIAPTHHQSVHRNAAQPVPETAALIHR